MEIHPAADLIPFNGEGLDKLAAEVKAVGLLEKLKTSGGKLLDGRRRLRACEMAGVEPEFEEVTDYPVTYVIRANLKPDRFTPAQAAIIAARATAMMANRSVADIANGAPPRSALRDWQESLFGVSATSIDRAGSLIANGIPELVAVVEKGHIPLCTAAEWSNLSHEEQRKKMAEPYTGRPQSPKLSGKRKGVSPESARRKTVKQTEPAGGEPKGVFLANEAVNCLIRIPRDDPQRERAFQIVTDWIKLNRTNKGA